MYICTYMYMYMFIYIHIYMYKHTYMCIYMHIYIYIHIFTYTHSNVYIFTQSFIHLFTQMRTNTDLANLSFCPCKSIYIFIYEHTYNTHIINLCSRICIYTCTLTCMSSFPMLWKHMYTYKYMIFFQFFRFCCAREMLAVLEYCAVH